MLQPTYKLLSAAFTQHVPNFDAGIASAGLKGKQLREVNYELFKCLLVLSLPSFSSAGRFRAYTRNILDAKGILNDLLYNDYLYLYYSKLLVILVSNFNQILRLRGGRRCW